MANYRALTDQNGTLENIQDSQSLIVGAGIITNAAVALTITGNAASIWSTSAGALTVQGFGGLNLYTPAGSGAAGQNIAITAGSGAATFAGGNLSKTAGTAGAASGATPAGTAGTHNMTAGAGGAASTTAGGVSTVGGTITLTSGAGGVGAATTNGASNAGQLNVNGGTGGASAGTNAGGVGGVLSILAGTGGAGSGGTAPGVGGAITITGGSAGASGTGNANGGAVTIDGGAKSGTGTVGTVNIGTVNTTTVNIGTVGGTVAFLGTAITSSLQVTSNLNLSGATVTGLTPGDLPAIINFTPATVPGLTDSIPEYNASASANRIVAYNYFVGFIEPKIFDFRLTGRTGVAVSTSDITSQGTIYLTPASNGISGSTITTAGSARLCLYDGSTGWKLYTSGELSLSLTATSGNMYDVFVYDNSGTLTLTTVAWTNTTTRATALDLQDGVLCLHGALNKRYCGTFYAYGTNVTADAASARYICNYYNRAWKNCESTDSIIRPVTSQTAVQVGSVNINYITLGDYFTRTEGITTGFNVGFLILCIGSGATTFHTSAIQGFGGGSVGVESSVISTLAECPTAGLVQRYLCMKSYSGGSADADNTAYNDGSTSGGQPQCVLRAMVLC